MILARSWLWGSNGVGAADILCLEALRAPSPPPGRRFAARVSPISDPAIEAELDAIAPAAPFAILLPRCRHGADVQRLAAKLAVREARLGLEAGAVGIVAIVGDHPAGLMALASFTGASSRLVALSGDAQALRRSLGGGAPGAVALARAQISLAAAAAGVLAFDGALAGPFDADAARAEAEAARAEGYAGKFARSLDEAAIYDETFAASS